MMQCNEHSLEIFETLKAVQTSQNEWVKTYFYYKLE